MRTPGNLLTPHPTPAGLKTCARELRQSDEARQGSRRMSNVEVSGGRIRGEPALDSPG
ncbi:MAG: hypothetical protein ABSC62_15305 [Terracidiphilus sp.]